MNYLDCQCETQKWAPHTIGTLFFSVLSILRLKYANRSI